MLLWFVTKLPGHDRPKSRNRYCVEDQVIQAYSEMFNELCREMQSKKKQSILHIVTKQRRLTSKSQPYI